ncbi:MAG: mannan-binding lectin, partial [Sphingomonas sp.]
INGAPAFGSWRLLYRITDADSDRRGRGWRGRRGGNGGGGGSGPIVPGGGDGGWGRNGTRNVEVGPIWNQRDAEQKCRQKANELRLEWTGQWSTTVPGRMSVCEMRRDGRGGGYGNGGGGGYGNGGGGGGYGGGVVREFDVGPIWNQRDAETKCRQKANELRGEWTGQWRTTVQGRMSVCEIRLR